MPVVEPTTPQFGGNQYLKRSHSIRAYTHPHARRERAHRATACISRHAHRKPIVLAVLASTLSILCTADSAFWFAALLSPFPACARRMVELDSNSKGDVQSKH
eukprot:5650725-Amphidinium_carterae.1